MLSVLKDILVNFYQNIFWTIEALSCYINTKKQQVVLLYDHLPVTCSDIIFCILSVRQTETCRSLYTDKISIYSALSQ